MEDSSKFEKPTTQPEPDGPNKPPRTTNTRIGAGETPGWSDIQTIREHPSSFIGSTRQSGLHHLIHELVLCILSWTDMSSQVELCVNANSSVTISVDTADWLNSAKSFEV